jgi:hypothetical protein
VNNGKAAADHPAVSKEFENLRRAGIRADVVVLGRAPEKEVPHSASDQKGTKTPTVESIEYLQGIRVDVLSGDLMILATEDSGFRKVHSVQTS